MNTRTPETTGYSYGVGVLLHHPGSSSTLFLKRGPRQDDPGVWGIPGGKVEDGEELMDALLRELHEETGIRGDCCHIEENPIYVNDNGNNFQFMTYIGTTEIQWPCMVNDEHTDWRWIPSHQTPDPLHWGVDKMFKDMGLITRTKVSPITADM